MGPLLPFPPAAGGEGYESKRCINAHLPQNLLLRAHTWGWTTMFPFLGGPPPLPLGLGVGAGGVGVLGFAVWCAGLALVSFLGALGNKVA